MVKDGSVNVSFGDLRQCQCLAINEKLRALQTSVKHMMRLPTVKTRVFSAFPETYSSTTFLNMRNESV